MSAVSIERAAAQRRKELAAIHVMAGKQLRLDEDTYRDLLERVSGKRTAADLDARGRSDVLEELRRLVNAAHSRMRNALPGAPQDVREDLRAMVGKVGAILDECGRSWNYAHGMAKRMFHVARVEWLNSGQLHKLVAALEIDRGRRARQQGAK